MDILVMLILPIHEHGICFHLFVSSLISSMLCSFLNTGILPPWLGLFLGILFYVSFSLSRADKRAATTVQSDLQMGRKSKQMWVERKRTPATRPNTKRPMLTQLSQFGHLPVGPHRDVSGDSGFPVGRVYTQYSQLPRRLKK